MAVSGLKNLPHEKAKEVRVWITLNKREIIDRLDDLVSPGMFNNFSMAKPWILEHEERLREYGFTTTDLFGYGQFAYPYGSWGVAWLNLWSQTDVEVCIVKKGIKFQWMSGGRMITQIARLRPK